MIISFNSHWPRKADYEWQGNLPLEPEICFRKVFDWLASLRLPRDEIHELVMPGVREGIVLTAYHALMGHFPKVYYSLRVDSNGESRWEWFQVNLQQIREQARRRRL